jgi:hypothetical protein
MSKERERDEKRMRKRAPWPPKAMASLYMVSS